MAKQSVSPSIADWPEDAQEAAQLVVDKYGEPDEITDTQITWHQPGPWKRIVASRTVNQHDFPAPHYDSVESVIDYRFPPEKAAQACLFDGSVVINRTKGEVSARCHDEEANFLALNLMHDIATGAKDVEQARNYYAKEFADYRRKKPTPYMQGLQFTPGGSDTADPDVRILTEKDLEEAAREGKEGA
ncbi:MAG TPA: hypothetical protein VIR76_09465 [Pusillimonas sp.]